ncbi:hypothetical protein COV23_00545 [Candidatus Wolfebacteria bacterium CG10_big_fil_rev_8_21_14_0_10_31_9]|uniref:Mur ligase central domain-containing protein n=1 Tax=Candidatus Wolfebacteria bacterium CG10_big_fil_rev_8_21_14_0_10_31_9 TaxID=1975070 RepID=A0A2H0RCX4_9BACT|nr:MAG: hypothetical protein COV23_00545 [Candidatus Wolfebacteria bacterium CG10_big_fil_rev_8_21_14_0_10_31_9]
MITKNLLYILQIENYSLGAFLKFSYSHFNWCNLEKRSKIVWTFKAKLIYILAGFLSLAVITASYAIFGYIGLISTIIIIPFIPLIISLALIIWLPLDFYLKNRLIDKARKIISERKNNLIVIGITGSYGKTSVKEILAAILKEKLKVVVPDKNINTDTGIADFIVKNKGSISQSDVFIVEMGAFKQGEIKKICDIVYPDYGILTGITDAHLEKFGSLENIIKTKFELSELTKNFIALNFDDENIKSNYEKFKIKDFTGVSSVEVENVKILENFSGIEFKFKGVEFHTKLLALHNVSLILLCIEIAKKMGMSLAEISKGVEKINYTQHRLEPIYNKQTNIWVIDDSYNGNFKGVKSGIEVLERTVGRKVILTPGLVELGEKSREVHNKIGQLYEESKVDLILLIKNKATKYIIEKLKIKKYKIYNSTIEAHNDLVNVLKSGDTIIFQNDLPDNYF